ncbi:MAG: GNAT family N-acetyltransferase [Anaerolineales bacterium]|nr:GNAT family N-acetyltransferase [Anaerolineales bacterium]
MPPTPLSIRVRSATLADVPAIVAIHRADIVAWKRWDADGLAHLANYAELRPDERWLNGGPWLDDSTYAHYLRRLLAVDSGGAAWVAEAEGQVRAVAEAWLGEEPPPFGRSLDLGVLYTLRGHAGRGLGSALMGVVRQHALAAGCDTLTVTHAEAPEFYAKQGLARAETWRRVRLTPLASQTLYTAEAVTLGAYDGPEGGRGWAMPLGRYQSARQEWERVRPGAQPDFVAWRGLRTEAWRLVARRKPAVLVLDEQPRERGVAEVHLWTPEAALSRQLMAAIRDRAARSGFTELMCFAAESTLPALGPGWRDDGYKQHVWRAALTSK